MPEIGTSSSMSEDGKRGVGHRPQATAPILDSTRLCENSRAAQSNRRKFLGLSHKPVLALGRSSKRRRTCYKCACC
jgi:hypothetical protein